MPTDRELMQQALDALECAKEAIEEWGSYASDYFKQKYNLDGDVDDCDAAIEALRARLAQCDAGEICLGCRVCPDAQPEPDDGHCADPDCDVCL